MNSIAQVETALKEFLDRREPGVMAVKGAWGVGKTYLWNNFIAGRKAVAGCGAYSYVSLFGIASLAELRRALFTNRRLLGPRRNRVAAWFGRAGSKMARHLELDLGPVAGVGLKNTELWAEAIENRALREVLVCLDDLERKDEGVTTAALLGFITNLRDEHRCKVVLLYNEDRARQIASIAPALAEYREKVIDRELVLNPTEKECYELVFRDAKYHFPGDTPHAPNPFHIIDSRSLLQLFEAMKVANIRVMQKIRVALDYLAAGLAEKYPRQWPDMARQTVKLAWLHYCHGGSFPLEDVADQDRWLAIYARRNRDEQPDEGLEKYAPVGKAGYHPHSTDLLIVEFLRLGFVDWTKHTALLDKREAERQRDLLKEKYHANWDLMWDNFQVPGEQVRATLLEFLRANEAALSLQHVSEITRFLRVFEKNPEAERMLAAKIDAFVQEVGDADPMFMTPHLLDPETARIIQQKLAARTATKPIGEAMVMLAGTDSWNASDLRHLQNVGAADFLAWLKAEKSPRLLHVLKTFRERFGTEETGKAIVATLDSALHEMARRSVADAKRVYQGVGLPKPDVAPAVNPPVGS